jgi:hypothetical protein
LLFIPIEKVAGEYLLTAVCLNFIEVKGLRSETMIKLLVSIKSVSELSNAVYGGADIVDIKDPSRGSLGIPDFSVVKAVIEKLRGFGVRGVEVSSAGGDVKGFSPELGYVAYAMASLAVDYFKIGLAMNDLDMARRVALQVSDALKSFSRTRLVLVGYADYIRAHSLEPLKVIEVARDANAHVVMIDTLIKDGKSTFDFLSKEYLRRFVEEAHRNGFLAALAGSLKKHHVIDAIELGFDVIGFRGAVCSGGRDGVVSLELVSELKKIIKSYYAGKMSVYSSSTP